MTLMEELKELLKEDTRFVDTEGKLLKNKIVEHALKLDKGLIKLLLKNKRIKEHFFKDVDGVLVFDKEKFMKFIDNKEFLPDSYTAFKNKIGLANKEGKYLAKSKEIVLVWPYKDCVLEGGQEKSDEKRKEIFHNVILAPDEIDRLLEPKVFTNFKRIDKDGEHQLDGFRRDDEINRKRGLPEDTITDNLIIKGNNLLVLYSLLKEFRGKVKLIYIDPPYNTGSDEFQYNDNFRHSTWLTFMKNRLEVAKELLKDDGAIFVQLDHHEIGYLNVLMDETFGRGNKVQIIAIKTASPAGFKVVNPGPIDVTEYILFYARDKKKFNFKLQYVEVEYHENYDRVILNFEDKPENWKLESIKKVVLEENGIPVTGSLRKAYKEAQRRWGKYWKIIFNQLIAEFALRNKERIVSIRDPHKPSESLKQLLIKSKKERDRIFVYGREGADPIFVINGGALAFYKNKVKNIGGREVPTELLTDFWGDISWAGIANEGGVRLKEGKKPEALLKRIIELSTEENDIVLDFFMGTGTTCAVAHKMGRQYIGVEQLDYGENSAVVRLKNVINGDQTGISKAVGWQGGGDFIYMGLMKNNEIYIEKIENAKTTEELLNIWKDINHNGFLSYRVDSKLFDENIEEFKALSLDEQKKLLLEMLEYNDLYVNYSEIDDVIYNVSEEDKKLNKDFYEERKDA
ncbi:DNA methyltransferase [Kosmotoga olearia]|uniref:DNA methylase N-4/N-6 domain protein n=1 Tax=Kosmotoga olearia (strain ATCC BAA-1733 / DSM 21960 / TBF 19.5.1) TaxID=521045 RepID=C5CHT5_KOSOT|nr:site-specific DNA-methyltransferase [Kosmotoga olearia]ACR78791.1 DNA methylase N-4/N-6 domain protein [Kosmotoga olearia TBF 19.5.1]